MKNTIPTIEYALEDRTDYTDSAFLVTALHWANQNGVWSAFKRLLDIDMKTVVYSPLHNVQTLLANIFVGCQFSDNSPRLKPGASGLTLVCRPTPVVQFHPVERALLTDSTIGWHLAKDADAFTRRNDLLRKRRNSIQCEQVQRNWAECSTTSARLRA